MQHNLKTNIAHDYVKLLLDFADHTGQLDQLDYYIKNTALKEDFPTVNFKEIKFDLN